MTTKNVLGWSSTFMKKGIALMLLLLHQGENYGKGMLAMLSRMRDACGFDLREYYHGTAMEAPEAYLEDEISFAEEADDDEDSTDEKIVFSDLLKTWKKEVHLSVNDSTLWMERIDHLACRRHHERKQEKLLWGMCILYRGFRRSTGIQRSSEGKSTDHGTVSGCLFKTTRFPRRTLLIRDEETSSLTIRRPAKRPGR